MGNFIQQIIDQYTTAQQQPVMFSVIAAVITGLLICFLGYKLLRLWCAIIGFAAGALISGLVAYAMGADVVLLVAVVVGVVTAILSFAFYKAGVFVIGFGSVLNIAGHLMNAYGVSARWWMIILAIVAAAVVGIIAVRFVRPIVIISTSLSGAASVVTNILGVFGITNWVIILSATGIVAVLGIVYQFTHTRKKHKVKTDNTDIEQTDTADIEWTDNTGIEQTEEPTEAVPDTETPALADMEIPSLSESIEENADDTEQAEREYTAEEEEESAE